MTWLNGALVIVVVAAASVVVSVLFAALAGDEQEYVGAVLGVDEQAQQRLNHGLGYGGKGGGVGTVSWVGEPASVVQPVAQRRR